MDHGPVAKRGTWSGGVRGTFEYKSHQKSQFEKKINRSKRNKHSYKIHSAEKSC